MKFIKNLLGIAAIALAAVLPIHGHSQQYQSQSAPLYATNAKYANGVSPGYAPCGTVNGVSNLNCPSITGLNIQIGQGTNFCNNTLGEAGNQTKTLTASVTNYVYLDFNNSCAVTVGTSNFSTNQFPIAVVTTNSNGITNIDDVRNFFVNLNTSSSGNTFVQPFVPPVAGQYVLVYPSAATLTQGGTGPCSVGGPEPTGSVTAVANGVNGSTQVTNGPCGNTISNNSWGVQFSGFSLPGFVTPSNVTAVYAVAISSVQNQTGGVLFGPTGFTSTGAATSLYPSGINANSSYSMRNTSTSTSITGSTLSSAIISVQTSRSVGVNSEAVINVTLVAFAVYYTGSAPPNTSGIIVEPPLFYNSALNQLGIDPNFPPDLISATISQLGSASASPNQLWLISDGTSATDCSVGGGSNGVLCYSNGSTWSALSSGGSSLTVQTNGTNNSSQSTLNQINSSANAAGLTDTVTNTSGGVVQHEIAGTLNTSHGGTGQTTVAAALAALLGGPSAGTYSIQCASSVSCSPVAASSGNINSGTSGQIAYYASSGTTISGLNVGTGLVITGGALTTVGQQPAQISSTFVGTLANGQIVVFIPVTFALTIPSSCTGSFLGAQVAATGSSAFTIAKLAGGPTGSATTLCTATFSASTVTASFSGSGGSLSVGDYIKVTGPSTADATLATIGFGLNGLR